MSPPTDTETLTPQDVDAYRKQYARAIKRGHFSRYQFNNRKDVTKDIRGWLRDWERAILRVYPRPPG